MAPSERKRTCSCWFPVALGGLCGAVGGAVGLILMTRMGSLLGPILSVLAAAALGMPAVRFALIWLANRTELAIAGIGAGQGDAGAEPDEPSSAGWACIDAALDQLRTECARLARFENDAHELDRLARSVWQASVAGQEGTPNSSPPAGARRCFLDALQNHGRVAEGVLDNAAALEKTALTIANSALDQGENVSQTTTTVESFSEKIDQISLNAESAAQASERTRQEAKRGLEQVHGLVEGMERLRGQVEANGRKVRRLGDRSNEIGTIVDTINGISSRTDMLALNATIESVRAGEHGRGFAVVAEEIRKLSERTAAATREISTLVEAIQADTNESIHALGLEQQEVEKETGRAREAGTALERISQVAEQSARLVEGISHSANDQVVATHQLVHAMQRISENTQTSLDESALFGDKIQSLISKCSDLHKLCSTLTDPPSTPFPTRVIRERSEPEEGATDHRQKPIVNAAAHPRSVPSRPTTASRRENNRASLEAQR